MNVYVITVAMVMLLKDFGASGIIFMTVCVCVCVCVFTTLEIVETYTMRSFIV
jgi:hypothetical protein